MISQLNDRAFIAEHLPEIETALQQLHDAPADRHRSAHPTDHYLRPVDLQNALARVGALRENPELRIPASRTAKRRRGGAAANAEPFIPEDAFVFAKAFYMAVTSKPSTPYASIVQRLRARAYASTAQQGDDTFAAYCWFGDPLANGGAT